MRIISIKDSNHQQQGKFTAVVSYDPSLKHRYSAAQKCWVSGPPKGQFCTATPTFFRFSVLKLASWCHSGAKSFQVASRLLEKLFNFEYNHRAQTDKIFFCETFNMDVTEPN